VSRLKRYRRVIFRNAERFWASNAEDMIRSACLRDAQEPPRHSSSSIVRALLCRPTSAPPLLTLAEAIAARLTHEVRQSAPPHAWPAPKNVRIRSRTSQAPLHNPLSQQQQPANLTKTCFPSKTIPYPAIRTLSFQLTMAVRVSRLFRGRSAALRHGTSIVTGPSNGCINEV
jgi:hypothetical protein